MATKPAPLAGPGRKARHNIQNAAPKTSTEKYIFSCSGVMPSEMYAPAPAPRKPVAIMGKAIFMLGVFLDRCTMAAIRPMTAEARLLVPRATLTGRPSHRVYRGTENRLMNAPTMPPRNPATMPTPMPSTGTTLTVPQLGWLQATVHEGATDSLTSASSSTAVNAHRSMLLGVRSPSTARMPVRNGEQTISASAAPFAGAAPAATPVLFVSAIPASLAG